MIVTVALHLTIALRAALTSSVLHKIDPRKLLKGQIMVFETALLRHAPHSHEVVQAEYHGGLLHWYQSAYSICPIQGRGHLFRETD